MVSMRNKKYFHQILPLIYSSGCDSSLESSWWNVLMRVRRNVLMGKEQKNIQELPVSTIIPLISSSGTQLCNLAN